MRWWKKGILFFLNSFCFFSCDTQTKDLELHEKPKEEIIELVKYYVHSHPVDEKTMDSLIDRLNNSQHELEGFKKENPIDKGNWLVSAKTDGFLFIVKNYLNEVSTAYLYETKDLHIWRLESENNKKLKEISISPHPTETFLLTMRERQQE
jgi:hypothetical protein